MTGCKIRCDLNTLTLSLRIRELGFFNAGRRSAYHIIKIVGYALSLSACVPRAAVIVRIVAKHRLMKFSRVKHFHVPVAVHIVLSL